MKFFEYPWGRVLSKLFTIILRSSAHKGYFIKRVITAFKVINKYLFHETHCKTIVRNFLNATAWWVLSKLFTIVLWSSSHKGCFIKRVITAFKFINKYLYHETHCKMIVRHFLNATAWWVLSKLFTIILQSSFHKGRFIERVITAFKVINKYLFHETRYKMIVRNFLNATAWWVLSKLFTIILRLSSHIGCFVKRVITAFKVFNKYLFHETRHKMCVGSFLNATPLRY